MNIKLKSLATGVMLAVAMGAANQASAFSIDTFDTTAQSVFSVGSLQTDGLTASEAIGGYRELSLATSGGLSSMSVDSIPTFGSLALSNNSGVSSTASVLWNANGVGLGGLDLTDSGASTALLLAISGIDQGSVVINFTVTETSGAGGESASLSLSGLGIGTQTFLFSTFTNFANVDFTAVDAIKMDIIAGNASDLTLDLVETNDTQLPEPSSLILMGLGFASFSALRKRK